MKKVLATAMLITAATFGVDLKGFDIGSKLSNNSNYNNIIKLNDKVSIFKTSVAGVGGIEYIGTTDSGYIYMVTFVPANGYDIERITESETYNIISGVENHYSVKLNNVPTTKCDYKLVAKKDGYTYTVVIDQNPYLDPEYDVSFIIVNDSLFDINEKEETERNSNDF